MKLYVIREKSEFGGGEVYCVFDKRPALVKKQESTDGGLTWKDQNHEAVVKSGAYHTFGGGTTMGKALLGLVERGKVYELSLSAKPVVSVAGKGKQGGK